ncbi:hypothetical protein R1CP_37010 (plasmid) [Rhodococcus opacus]|uniref:Uncharacterized protein n=1 Tax=Rhodococcus opacus TaxID=37919 RepID=A0A1B1KHE8_RHOOP|nr:hypothetical protein [Rhodococcus opacus]ANS32008.1 hypothetical protein R1CP_37010 [Rhodococcus opacus]
MTTEPFDLTPDDADRTEQEQSAISAGPDRDDTSAVTESTEASEADLLEQAQPLDEAELAPITPSQTWDANEADLLEQAQPVPSGEDERDGSTDAA